MILLGRGRKKPKITNHSHKQKHKQKPDAQLNSFHSHNQKNAPTQTPLTPKLPSLSPISIPKIFTRSYSEIRESTQSTPSLSSSTSTKKRNKSVSNEVRQALNGFYFCADTLESPSVEHH